jgi:hypothetical protein
MGSPYQSQSATGYNTSPPPDDGSTTASNKITWASIKTKLADSLKTLADAINSQLRTALDVSATTTSTTYTTLVSDHLKPIEVTGTTTISLGDAATMVAQAIGYQVTIRNKGTAFVTVKPVTAADTLDGISSTNGGSAVLAPGQSKTFGVNQASNGYGTIGESFTGDPMICEFRLTLTSGTAVTTSDVTGAGTLYCTPYKGNRISLFDGTGNWNTRPSAEFSLALTLTSGKPYDIFCYDNAGVPTLESLVWTDNTNRATALTLQNGVYVKSGATTRRYMGTIYASGANTTEDSNAKRYVWNNYNRIIREFLNTFTADRSTASTTYVELNSEIRCQFVIGVAEDAVVFGVNGSCGSAVSANQIYKTAIGFDGTTQEAGFQNCYTVPANINSGAAVSSAPKVGLLGFHYATVLGATSAGNSTAWHSADATTTQKVYLHGRIIG